MIDIYPNLICLYLACLVLDIGYNLYKLYNQSISIGGMIPLDTWIHGLHPVICVASIHFKWPFNSVYLVQYDDNRITFMCNLRGETMLSIT